MRFTNNYLTGKGLKRKGIFKNRFVLFFKKEYIPNETEIIDYKALNSSTKIARRSSRVVSLDLKDNLKLRFHDNAKKARSDILELLDQKIEIKSSYSSDTNFINSYVTPTIRNKYKPTLFKKRFHFL